MEVGARAAWGRAPERLVRAATAVDGLRADGVFLAPVRHHSPACALAVEALVAQVRPAVVLVEGPEEYTRLVPTLLDDGTRPPVAILSVGEDRQGAGFYPLAEFSPEWVAVRAAGRLGAEVAFIDRSWTDRAGESGPRDTPGGEPAPEEATDGEPGAGEAPGDESGAKDPGDDAFARTLQAERNLAHSRSVAALARRFGCRDHDELWDHLFEARNRADLADWRVLFDDVFAWAALARLDYEEEVLAADGSLDREALMSARIAEHRARADGPIVVVTGAFHTLALVEALAGAAEGEPVRRRQPLDGFGAPAEADAWLIRYDNERLDGLRGHGAGMPSPGFYRRLWAHHRADGDRGSLAVEVLVDVAGGAVANGGLISVAEVGSAAEQAIRLAALRERPTPCRTDILDALTSCFVKDDGGLDRPFAESVAAVFGGRELGEVPAGTASPPLVREARARAELLRLVVTDSAPRRSRLDARRNPRHRERRQFLALMGFVGTRFAHQVSGPDHVAGRGLGRVLEEWEYAWTPLVEAALVECSHRGATLEAVALDMLREKERALTESGRSSDGVATLMAQAVVVGLTDHLDRLAGLLRATFDVDPSLESVASSLHRLVGLWDARGELGLGEHADDLLGLVDHGLATASYLVPSLGAADVDAEAAAITTLVSLRDLARELERAGAGQSPGQEGASPTGTGTAPDGPGEAAPDRPSTVVAAFDRPGEAASARHATVDTAPMLRELARLRADRSAAPGVRGALVALGAVDGEVPDDELVAQVRAQLEAGADPLAAVRFLGGVMRAAPDLLLHTPEVFDAVHAGLRDMSGDAFLAVLPDLRRAFTWLKPTETHRLAERVARRTGVRAEQVDAVVTAGEEDLHAGLAVERELVAVLARDGLAEWVAGGAGAGVPRVAPPPDPSAATDPTDDRESR